MQTELLQEHFCNIPFCLFFRFLMIHVNRFEMQNYVVKKLHNYLKIPMTLTLKHVISQTETMLPMQWMSDSHKRYVTFQNIL
jgi:uncharacterized UBP type Zn finger protein